MEVRIVEEPKNVENVETPIVYGGVYRHNSRPFTYVIARPKAVFSYDIAIPAKYAVTCLETGECFAWNEEEMRRIVDQRLTFVPNAYLAIPKTLD